MSTTVLVAVFRTRGLRQSGELRFERSRNQKGRAITAYKD
jgi:hypothetical protein